MRKTRYCKRPWDGQRETLDDLAGAVHYNEWICRMLSPYLGKRILEIGCGIGNLTGFLAKQGKVLAVDVNPGYIREARRRLKDVPGISYKKVNLEKNLFTLRSFRPDTVICVNVLEHILDDRRVLRECYRLLPPGGKLLLFVPAFQFLFGSMDRSYGHYRRYSLRELKQVVGEAMFRVEYCRYLNLLGVLGWWLNSKILKRKIITKSQIMLYNRIVWFAEKIERFLPKPIGLSLYCVGQKPAFPATFSQVRMDL